MLTREGFGVSVNELMTAGQKPLQILQNTLKETSVLELRNCTVDELLYFIDQGTPVLARTGADEAILLTGYSSNKVNYYNPATKQTKSADYDEIEEIFQAGGHYFIAYVK